MSLATARDIDPTPPRPAAPIHPPAHILQMTVDVDAAHLANPLVAASRLLVSEGDALARVVGDEQHFVVSVALPDPAPETLDHAEAWIRWAVHNAGIRGRVRRVSPTSVDREAPPPGW